MSQIVHWCRLIGVVLFSFSILLALATTSRAGVVSGDDWNVTFTAGPGETNDVGVIAYSPREIEIFDNGAPITETSSACTSADGVVSCLVDGPAHTTFDWYLGDGYDYFAGTDDAPFIDRIDGGWQGDSIGCGAGRDEVSYANRTMPVYVTPDNSQQRDGELLEQDDVQSTCEDILGGSAADTLDGSDDFPGWITGNDGDDLLTASAPGSGEVCSIGSVPMSQLHGGNGDDRLFATAGRNRLVGGAGADVVVGGSGCDNAEGGPGSDVVVGGAGNDFVLDHFEDSTSSVNFLDGGNGADQLMGGIGSDTMMMMDEVRTSDNFICGYGVDYVLADLGDVWNSDLENPSTMCESIKRRP